MEEKRKATVFQEALLAGKARFDNDHQPGHHAYERNHQAQVTL